MKTETLGIDKLARVYADRHGVSLKEAKEAISRTFDIVADTIVDGFGVSIMGKFSFLPTVHKAKETFNPKTKEKVHVPEKKAVRFKLSSVLKEALNK